MGDTSRTISQSNIPGLPEKYRNLLAEAKESIEDVQSKLEEKPLDMGSVQFFLKKRLLLSQVYTKTRSADRGNAFCRESDPIRKPISQ